MASAAEPNRVDERVPSVAPAWAAPAARWALRNPAVDAGSVRAMARTLSLPQVVCAVLASRGIGDTAAARTFLKPRRSQLLDPFRLADMSVAVARIMRAMRDGETVLVHGDYDVDGVCSAALLTRALRRWGAHVHAFVPHRMRDGYDLGHAGVRAAAACGATLIITADCGVTAHDAVAQAGAAGIDVIVTDHHTTGATLPGAVAVVNPHRADCGYGERVLAGAGVAFKLCQALAHALDDTGDALWYDLDLVALATIADLAPLHGENRVLTHYGLRVLAVTRNTGVAALVRAAGLEAGTAPGAGQVSHTLAPRLNALGRLGAADRALRLLLVEDEAAARQLAAHGEEENRRRQALDRQTLRDVVARLEREADPARDQGLVLADAGWHAGVIGIVASRLVELVHRPVFLLAIDEDAGRARGSGRSVPGLDLYAAVHECRALLTRYGGHRQAAGVELPTGNIPRFREAFNQAVSARLDGTNSQPCQPLDAELHLEMCNPELLRALQYLGPFGVGNPTPVFAVRAAHVRGAPREVGAGHLRVVLEQHGARLPAIGFRLAGRCLAVAAAGCPVDVAFQLQEDRWQGRTGVQARLLDMRPSACAS